MRDLIEVLTWFCTGGLTASAALRTGSGAWAALRARPALFVRALVAVWIVVPLFAMVIVRAFSFRGETRAAVILLSISPGIPGLLAAARRQGPRALADGVVFLTLTSATVPLLLPIWARIMTVAYALPLVTSPRELVGILVPTVYVPLALGLVVHRCWPLFARRITPVLEYVASAGTVVIAIFLVVVGFPVLRTLQPLAIIAAPLLVLGCGFAGWLVAWRQPDARKLFVRAAAMGNPALGLALVATTYPTERAATVGAAVLIVRGLCLPVLSLLTKTGGLKRLRRSHREPTPT